MRLVQLRNHNYLLLHIAVSFPIGGKGEVYAAPLLVDKVLVRRVHKMARASKSSPLFARNHAAMYNAA